jgi:hypothetical protein
VKQMGGVQEQRDVRGFDWELAGRTFANATDPRYVARWIKE